MIKAVMLDEDFSHYTLPYLTSGSNLISIIESGRDILYGSPACPKAECPERNRGETSKKEEKSSN